MINGKNWMNRKSNQGSTMTEVLVAFAMLMILVASITGIIRVSSNMLFMTRDMLNAQNHLEAELCKKDHGNMVVTELPMTGIVLSEKDFDGNSLGGSLTLNHGRMNELVQPTTVEDRIDITIHQVFYKAD